MYGRNSHSTSASVWWIVPCRISYAGHVICQLTTLLKDLAPIAKRPAGEDVMTNVSPRTAARPLLTVNPYAKSWQKRDACAMSAFQRRTHRGPLQPSGLSKRDGRTHLKLMKSFSFANVITRLASSFGTGNSAFNIPVTLSPSVVLKPSKTRWGYCSLTVLVAFELTSCRRVTLWSVSERVGPCGRWEIIMASGRPRVSCRRIRSVTFWERQAGMRERITVLPRLRR